MRRVQPELTPELMNHFTDVRNVASHEAFPVATFRKLVEQTAKLSFKNKDYLIFYRGQSEDHKNKAQKSTFYPSIYRGEYLTKEDLRNRFIDLKTKGKVLSRLFQDHNIDGHKEITQRKQLQYSVLQHYEVCPTPYLDITQSLRVACSFATMDKTKKHVYVYAFGLPYITNRISTNSEHDLINIRLLSICPPAALRPYFQEGYLVGTDNITDKYESKSELDFNNRLFAKFIIPNNNNFWGNGFSPIPKEALQPPKDPVYELCKSIKEQNTGNLIY